MHIQRTHTKKNRDKIIIMIFIIDKYPNDQVFSIVACNKIDQSEKHYDLDDSL